MRTLGIFFSRSLLEKEESLILIDERGELFERKEVGGWKIEKCVLFFSRAIEREGSSHSSSCLSRIVRR